MKFSYVSEPYSHLALALKRGAPYLLTKPIFTIHVFLQSVITRQGCPTIIVMAFCCNNFLVNLIQQLLIKFFTSPWPWVLAKTVPTCCAPNLCTWCLVRVDELKSKAFITFSYANKRRYCNRSDFLFQVGRTPEIGKSSFYKVVYVSLLYEKLVKVQF